MKKPSHKSLVAEAKRLAKKRGLKLHPSLLAEYPIGTLFYCLHHDNKIPTEKLKEPLINRVMFVLENKPKHELAVRLAAMRPVLDEAKCASLYADYNAKRAPLYADYNAKRAPLYADYEAKRAPLYADYNAKCASLDADCEAKRAPLYADYEAKIAPLYADYNAKRAPLYADYEAKRAPLYADYEAQWDEEYPDHPKWTQKTGLEF